MLKAIAIALIVLVFLTWISADDCEAPEMSIEEVEKYCMRKHLEFKCNEIDKKNHRYWKHCEQLGNCLKNP